MSLIADALKKVYEKNIRFNKTANPRVNQSNRRDRNWRYGTIGVSLVALASLIGNGYQYWNRNLTQNQLNQYAGTIKELEQKLADASKIAPSVPAPQVTPSVPQVEYADKVYEVEKGDVLERIIRSNYFSGKKDQELMKEVAEYKDGKYAPLPADSKLKAGQVVYVPMFFGEGNEGGAWNVKYAVVSKEEYNAAKKKDKLAHVVAEGATLYQIVRATVNNQINAVAQANNLTVDNRAVTPVGNSTRVDSVKGLPFIDFVKRGYPTADGRGDYTNEDLAVVDAPDSVVDGGKDGYIHPEQKLTLKDYKVKKEASQAQQQSTSQQGPTSSYQTDTKEPHKKVNLSTSPLENSIRKAVYRPNESRLPEDTLLREISARLAQRYFGV